MQTASKQPKLPRVMLLIETSRAYGRCLVEGIGRYVDIHGPWWIDFQERSLDAPFPRGLKQWRGDGIISRTTRQTDIDRLLTLGCPIVELFADPALGLPRVYADQQVIAELAVEHFLDRGLRYMAFFATEQAWWIETRCDAFKKTADQHEVSCEIFQPKQTRKGAAWFDEQEVGRWIRSLPKPCGIFCASDGFAMPLMNVCREIGVSIPEQIAVLGVDNDPVICSVTQPPLSSIDMNAERIGYEAAALLDRMMAGEYPPKEGVRVDTEGIVARQSTDILALADPEVAQAIRIIRQRACRRLRVAQVAEGVALSRRALEQRFRRALGRTPKDEISRVQMERACRLLRQTTMSIEQVAQKSGFHSFKYFARAFRREMGVTPRAYRQAHLIPRLGE